MREWKNTERKEKSCFIRIFGWVKPDIAQITLNNSKTFRLMIAKQTKKTMTITTKRENNVKINEDKVVENR